MDVRVSARVWACVRMCLYVCMPCMKLLLIYAISKEPKSDVFPGAQIRLRFNKEPVRHVQHAP